MLSRGRQPTPPPLGSRGRLPCAPRSQRHEPTPRDTGFGVRVSFRTPVNTNANELWDLDNLIKPTLDAMEGIFGQRAWRGLSQAADDRVELLQASKRTVRDGESPGAHIEVIGLEGRVAPKPATCQRAGVPHRRLVLKGQCGETAWWLPAPLPDRL
jgi:hypothetical protein